MQVKMTKIYVPVETIEDVRFVLAEAEGNAHSVSETILKKLVSFGGVAIPNKGKLPLLLEDKDGIEYVVHPAVPNTYYYEQPNYGHSSMEVESDIAPRYASNVGRIHKISFPKTPPATYQVGMSDISQFKLELIKRLVVFGRDREIDARIHFILHTEMQKVSTFEMMVVLRRIEECSYLSDAVTVMEDGGIYEKVTLMTGFAKSVVELSPDPWYDLVQFLDEEPQVYRAANKTPTVAVKYDRDGDFFHFPMAEVVTLLTLARTDKSYQLIAQDIITAIVAPKGTSVGALASLMLPLFSLDRNTGVYIRCMDYTAEALISCLTNLLSDYLPAKSTNVGSFIDYAVPRFQAN